MSSPATEPSKVECLSRPASAFESAYLAVRQKEGRIYSDEVVRGLPVVEKSHPLYKEWQMRAFSARLIVRQLQKLPVQSKVLEVGCGNGWLSAYIAMQGHLDVTGLDINLEELEQAARVFADVPNLRFCYGDLFESIFPQGHFDVICLAAAAQYFPDFHALIDRLFYFLSEKGQIIIADTHFYDPPAQQAAKERTIQYFTSLGFPQMAEHYFHHLRQDMERYNPQWLYEPQKLANRLGNRLFGKSTPPFPVTCISR